MSSRRLVLRTLLVAMGLCGIGGAQAWAARPGRTMAAGDIVVSDPRLTESSALAVSPVDPDLLYTVNDSGHDPVVYVVDRRDGTVVGTTALSGVDPDGADTEAIAVDRDGVLWVADIGDNMRSRDDVALYALPAPGPGDATVTARPLPGALPRRARRRRDAARRSGHRPDVGGHQGPAGRVGAGGSGRRRARPGQPAGAGRRARYRRWSPTARCCPTAAPWCCGPTSGRTSTGCPTGGRWATSSCPASSKASR